jgi:TolB-like protein/cytochrome c-type biogenesis protein CcmH/NrfG
LAEKAACKLVLLGGFSLRDVNGAEVPLSTRKDRLLLAFLALSGGRPQGRDRLAGLLWGDRGEIQARDSLRQSLASLRQAFRNLGLDPLRTDRESVTFEPSGIEIDALEFSRLAQAAPDEAIRLYRGELLEDMDGITAEFEEWLGPERQHFIDRAARLVEAASACAGGAAAEAAITLGRHLLAKDRLREPVYLSLMQIHAQVGDRTEALKLYAACRDALRQDLGVAPDPKTEALYRAILAEEPDKLAVTITPSERSGEPTSERLSIAVLPFNNMSGDQEQQYFSDGFTEDIITELSRFRSFSVMARNSSFVYRGDSVDVRKVGCELGVRFVVEGSVRRTGDLIRISAQLLETVGGNHLWAERYDRPIRDLFSVQDELVQMIVATIAARLEDSEISGAKRRRTDNLAAYDCLLRGIEYGRGYGPDDNRKARELFERAIELDPDYALAHAYVALALMMEHDYDQAPDSIKERALQSALKAVRLDPDEGRCQQFLAQIYLYRAEHDQAMFHLERSLARNPNDAHALTQYGFALTQVGRAEEGIKWIKRAMQLNPFHPQWYWADLAIACYAACRFEEALEANKRMGAATAWIHARRAACCAQLGRMEDARAEAAEALRLDPGFRVSTIRLAYKYQIDRDRLLDGMRKAGLPD